MFFLLPGSCPKGGGVIGAVAIKNFSVGIRDCTLSTAQLLLLLLSLLPKICKIKKKMGVGRGVLFNRTGQLKSYENSIQIKSVKLS